MLSVKVLRPVCADRDRLVQFALRGIVEIKEQLPELETVVRKVADQERFLDYQVLARPGLIVNERLARRRHLRAREVPNKTNGSA